MSCTVGRTLGYGEGRWTQQIYLAHQVVHANSRCKGQGSVKCSTLVEQGVAAQGCRCRLVLTFTLSSAFDTKVWAFRVTTSWYSHCRTHRPCRPKSQLLHTRNKAALTSRGQLKHVARYGSRKPEN